MPSCVVTAVGFNGFYLQDPTGGGDAATSDAIFVFTSSRPTVATRTTAQVVSNAGEVLTPAPGSGQWRSTTAPRS